jgi:hypothetical protein
VGAMTVHELVTILQALPDQNATVVIGEALGKPLANLFPFFQDCLLDFGC